MDSLNSAILVIGLVVEAVLFGLAYNAEHSKANDWFLYLLSLDMVEAPVLMSIFLSGQTETYYYCYWIGEILDSFFRVMLVVRAEQASGVGQNRALRLLISALIGIAASVYPIHHAQNMLSLNQVVTIGNLFVYVALAAYILLRYATVVGQPGFPSKLLNGMCMYSAFRAVGYFGDAVSHNGARVAIFVSIRIGYLLVLLYLLLPLLRASRERRSYGF